MKPLAVAAVLIVSACSPMDQYVEGQVVHVDGQDYLIRKLSNGAYQAVPSDQKATLHVDAADRTSDLQAAGKLTRALSILGTGLRRAAKLSPL